MKNIIFQALLILTFTTSCNKPAKKNATTTPDILTETPEVLDGGSNYRTGSLSKRYDSDIISELYEEAMEKNSNLEKLHQEIIKMSEMENDSLSEYSKFASVNTSYYSNAKVYANRIQDSLLKESTLAVFNAIEAKYEAKMETFVEKQLIITEKSKALDDQLILMKLYVTELMIRNYQNNEKPDIKTLENIIKKYDSLIIATEKFTQIK